MSDVTERLLSRASTMLRGATFIRPNPGTPPGPAYIQETLTFLKREKTKLELHDDKKHDIDSIEFSKSFLEEIALSAKNTTSKEVEREDSDYDTDLEEETEIVASEEEETKLVDIKTVYKKNCRQLGIDPIPAVETSVDTPEIKVLNRHLNSLDMLAITSALISNLHVTSLALDGNNIGNEGAQLLAWVVKDKKSLVQELSISSNNIGSEGFQAISEALKTNRTISHLNMSGNEASEEDIKTISSALKKNFKLNVLNLSYNGISDRAAKYLASAIAYNEGLTSLDLSWNKIRPTGAVAVCHALKENVILKTLNLSMNGLSTPGSLFIGETLKTNASLTYLDVSYNRIYNEGAAHIAKGLQVNETLHHLILHHNPLTSLGVTNVLTSIANNANTGMWKLDVQSVPITKSLLTTYQEYHTRNDGFKFIHGVVVDSESAIIGNSNSLHNHNPMAMVKNYIEEEGLRLTDFFRIMDKDGGGTISREEFIDGLKKAKVPMSQAQLDELIDILDMDGDGEIDYSELVHGDKEYRRRRLKKKLQAVKAFQKSAALQKPEESWMA